MKLPSWSVVTFFAPDATFGMIADGLTAVFDPEVAVDGAISTRAPCSAALAESVTVPATDPRSC